MSCFICEKCGCIDNSAMANNFWVARGNIYSEKGDKAIFQDFFDEKFYNNHLCCTECCKGIHYSDTHKKHRSLGWHNKFPKRHWSYYGREECLTMERRGKGDCDNATRYFKLYDECKLTEIANLFIERLKANSITFDSILVSEDRMIKDFKCPIIWIVKTDKDCEDELRSILIGVFDTLGISQSEFKILNEIKVHTNIHNLSIEYREIQK